jgi:hypothetical protein
MVLMGGVPVADVREYITESKNGNAWFVALLRGLSIKKILEAPQGTWGMRLLWAVVPRKNDHFIHDARRMK